MSVRGSARSADAAAASPPRRALPKGTRLQDFELIGVIHDGSFGIDYLAFDAVQRQQVVVKEYLPSMLAWRAPATLAVTLKSPAHDEAFRAGMRSFVGEARLLERFDHPALVAVHHHWRDHGTVYMAMPLVDGPTLRRVIVERGGAPDEAELRAWLRPLLDALAMLHAEHCVHGDITPDNILITANGPVLLGFGGGRHMLGDTLRKPAEVLKPGYAPIEQYAPHDTASQGPWTDVYALAAVVYAALTGRAPMAAIERRPHDALAPLRSLVAGRFSESLINAVDAALAVQPADRPRGVAEFRALLNGQRPATAVVGHAADATRDADEAPAAGPTGRLAAPLLAAGVLCAAALAVLAWMAGMR